MRQHLVEKEQKTQTNGKKLDTNCTQCRKTNRLNTSQHQPHKITPSTPLRRLRSTFLFHTFKHDSDCRELRHADPEENGGVRITDRYRKSLAERLRADWTEKKRGGTKCVVLVAKRTNPGAASLCTESRYAILEDNDGVHLANFTHCVFVQIGPRLRGEVHQGSLASHHSDGANDV